MGVLTVERHVARPLEAVWAVASDVAAVRLPVTRVEKAPGSPGVGWRFVGVSGAGPAAIHDSMLVTRWRPPVSGSPDAEYAVVKTGWVLGGWAEVTLRRLGPELTRLRWREEIVLRPRVVGAALAAVTDIAVRAMFERAVDDLVRRA
ncbi:MAG: hypothetical protein ACOYBY_03930 [Dermatophilaceae bacterium]